MTFVFTPMLTLTPLRRFRWVYCQIETLRRCFLASLRRVLGELPETLDGTYEQALRGIDKHKRDYAYRLFQCLVVSKRPLRVEELAELFAIEPNAETIPTFNSSLRPANPEELVLSACSTLIAVVNVGRQKIVQFSHFSVREYLTSNRLAISKLVSHFHILPRPAHALLARACLGVLLQLDNLQYRAIMRNFPLVSYAAQYWVDHARFENVSSDIQHGIECLFDRNKSHLGSWLSLYNIHNSSDFEFGVCPSGPQGVALYYAALCGFRNIAEHLLDAHPQDVNGRGGVLVTPLNAAVWKGYLSVVILLVERGADLEFRDVRGRTPLHLASAFGHAKIVSFLIERGADPFAQTLNLDGDDWQTPLHLASMYGRDEIVRILVDLHANVNHRDKVGRTSLHCALMNRHNFSTVKLLLDLGAAANCRDDVGQTSLYYASRKRYNDVVQLLLNHGADTNYSDNDGMAPLHHAAQAGHYDTVQLLLKYGADANLQDSFGWTPRDHASTRGHFDTAQLLALATRLP